MRAVLRQYADRGVFRGFSERRRSGGEQEFRFTWLTREPMVVRYQPRRRTLTFSGVFPGVARSSALAADVETLVASRFARSVPAHRRIDRRRVDVACAYARGKVSIVLSVKGRQHAYAVQKGVNLVNELFTMMQVAYPEYLWEVFGLPAE